MRYFPKLSDFQDISRNRGSRKLPLKQDLQLLYSDLPFCSPENDLPTGRTVKQLLDNGKQFEEVSQINYLCSFQKDPQTVFCSPYYTEKTQEREIKQRNEDHIALVNAKSLTYDTWANNYQRLVGSLGSENNHLYGWPGTFNIDFVDAVRHANFFLSMGESALLSEIAIRKKQYPYKPLIIFAGESLVKYIKIFLSNIFEEKNILVSKMDHYYSYYDKAQPKGYQALPWEGAVVALPQVKTYFTAARIASWSRHKRSWHIKTENKAALYIRIDRRMEKKYRFTQPTNPLESRAKRIDLE